MEKTRLITSRVFFNLIKPIINLIRIEMDLIFFKINEPNLNNFDAKVI